MLSTGVGRPPGSPTSTSDVAALAAIGPPLSRRRIGLVAVAALSFAALYLARSDNAALGDAATLLLLAPIAILAFELGVRGGIAGALVALVLSSVWAPPTSIASDALADAARAVAFLALGAGIGRVADLHGQLERELVHARDMSLQMIATASFDGVFRNRYRAADGGYRWLEWNAHVEPGEIDMYATARDITSEKQAEELLATHAGILELQVAARTADLDRARLGTLRRLAFAAELRDDETRHHTDRVGRTAALISIELGLPATFVSQIQQAAPVHDVGKLGISDAILLKPARLTADELVEMRTHAQIGHAILSGSDCPVLQLAAAISLTHHERWDGAGYPNGLTGDEIPLAGRIVALADVFDALSHARPYKEAWPIARVVATIDEGAGLHFDPQVVAAFHRLDPFALMVDPPCGTATGISEEPGADRRAA